MKHKLLFILSCSVGLALAVSCEGAAAPVTCSASTCSGCCDAAGVCQLGNTVEHCGRAGFACDPCSTGDQCSDGRCVGNGDAPTGGGAGSTGGGSGSTGGGTASSGGGAGGGTSSTGGGTASTGGGTATTGGGTGTTGGGTGSTGGGTGSTGGGTGTTGGGTGSTGGGTGSTGGGGGNACVPSPPGTCSPTTCSTGNSQHVGAYCTKGGGQCSQYNLSCAIDLSSQGENFCIKLLCFSNSDCGPQACCVGDPSQGLIKACVPMGCAVEDGGAVCPQ